MVEILDSDIAHYQSQQNKVGDDSEILCVFNEETGASQLVDSLKELKFLF